MKLKNLIEYVHQHHPHMGEAEIIDRVNRVIETLCKQFDVMEDSWKADTVANTRSYPLATLTVADGTAIETIKDVYIERKKIPRIEKPVIDDNAEFEA